VSALVRSDARFALLALLVSVASCSRGGSKDSTPTAPVPVLTTVTVTLGATTLLVGQTTQAYASGLDQHNASIATGAVTWSSATPAVATVSANGSVKANAAGQATITATSGTKSGASTVTVVSAQDFAIVDAQFTQGVQTPNATIPMILSGNAAVVNVLVRASVPSALAMQVVLRLFDASGALVRTDTAQTSGSLGSSPSYQSPSAQFLVPASAIATGVRWQVERDPKHLVPDDTAANDVFPRSGRAALATTAVPPLNVRFVPIVLAANGNATGNVSTATLPQYLQTLLSIHPLGVVSAHVGTTFTTNASFGTAPSGGAAPFWQQLLSELDLARLADPVEPAANWYGVVLPPQGFNFTSFGGFSYIPATGTSTGANTRTSAGVQINWFNRATQARDLVAHEIGHTFGRMHAPCGAPAAPIDPNYPVAGGTLDVVGHDVYSWATGAAFSAATVSTATGDVMGYCFPVWASTYTYAAVLNFRGTTATLAQAAAPRTAPMLVVRGRVEDDRDIVLEPAFVLDARPSLPERTGPYTVEGLDALGRVLFSYAFEPAVLDHSPNVRPFTISIPSTADLEQRLETIAVRGPAAAARISRPRSRPIAADVAPGAPGFANVVRDAAGMLAAACTDGSARGILVVDARSGSVLGSAAAATMRFVSQPGTPLAITCTDGVRSVRANSVAP
jgi:hypothetical protein